MAKSRQKRAAKITGRSRPARRGAAPAGPTWRAAAPHAVTKLRTRTWHARCIYAGNIGLDASQAIARLDRELAILGVPYMARYLGMRGRRATFRIEVDRLAGQVWDAVSRVGMSGGELRARRARGR